MPTFAKVSTQAHKICCQLSKNFSSYKSLSADEQKDFNRPYIKSVGTFRNYEQALCNVGNYLKENDPKNRRDLKNLTVESAKDYLEHRKTEVQQKTLDMERQAMQKVLQLNGNLALNETLDVTKSTIKTELAPRAYTPEQVLAISQHQTEKNALSTQIAYNASLRAHELLTIEKVSEKDVTYRPNKENEQKYGGYKFEGRQNTVAYIVTGKGGHVREIRLSYELAEKLEATRLAEPRHVVDRGVNYTQKYDIAGGQAWSMSFTRASKEALGFSNGAHGLRHSYAQERMDELRGNHSINESLAIDSLEMGHYRADITEVYLR
mgnify:CR=1 FL=1